MKTYNKLVRDLIPEYLEAKGITVESRVLDEVEREPALYHKLQEEVDELTEAKSAEELADVLEVLKGLAHHHNYKWEDIEKIRQDKVFERGGFDKGIWLISTKEPDEK